MRCLRCAEEIDRSFRACPHCGEIVTDFVRLYSDALLDGKYRILGRLGAGGMGEVYKAEHTFLGSTRVIKVIRPQISSSLDAHERFLREARMATLIQHPNVATVHDFSALADGSHYMVWEYIDGENLAQRIRSRGPLPPRTAVRLMIQALHGLEAIHRAGIVHRDISPENIMIANADESVKIIDLGVAKIDDPAEAGGTATGIFVGKLRYASPEQLGFLPENEKVDGRADIYAVGMVLYESLSGRPPYEATSPHQYFLMHSQDRQFTPVELPPDLPGGEDLQEAIKRALQRDRNKRFASAHEFAEALTAVERSLPDPGAMKTVALPMDFDSTMKVGTSRDLLHRTTVRTDATAVNVTPARQTPAPAASDPTLFAPRVAAPAAAPPPVPPAQVTTPNVPIPQNVPAAPPYVPVATEANARPTSKAPFIIVGLLVGLLIVGALIGGTWWLARRSKQAAIDPAAQPATTQGGTTQTAAPPSETTVDVNATTSDGTVVDAAPVAQVPTETTTIAGSPTPPPVRPGTTPGRRPTEPAADTGDTADAPEEPAVEPVQAEPETPANTYVENGDEDANERLAERMRQELRGTTRVAVHGGAMESALIAAMKDEFPSVEVVSSAPVVIEFEGLIEHKGRGRKTRYARAVIRKNGRVVFRYLLPTEGYRVGNTPVEAFIGVLGDAFSD